MKDRLLRCVVILLAVMVSCCLKAAQATDLTFEDRVKAQEALDRVYFRHQIGTRGSFEDAVPRRALETKVETYLKQTALLKVRWMRPLDIVQLDDELVRIEMHSRMPERVSELSEALGNDRFLLRECLARPLLAGRLARSFFERDSSIHLAARLEAETLRSDLISGRTPITAELPRRYVRVIVKSVGSPGAAADSLHPFETECISSPLASPSALEVESEETAAGFRRSVGEIGPLQEGSDSFFIEVVLDDNALSSVVAKYEVAKRSWDEWWAEVERELPLDPAIVPGSLPFERTVVQTTTTSSCRPDDTWELDRVPDPRYSHSAIWTGSSMLIWGGTYMSSGSIYDPATDTWTRMNSVGAPSGQFDQKGVWTGRELIAWGGSPASGGRYDPLLNAWKRVSAIGAPSDRLYYAMVWTGSKVVVFGGYGGTSLNTGAVYDPDTDRWSPTSTSGAWLYYQRPIAVWSGKEVLVYDTYSWGSGARYDPEKNSWKQMSSDGLPTVQEGGSAVWTGTEMIVWGGDLGRGGRYDPETDQWQPVSQSGAPSGRRYHTAVWTGQEMVVWGGNAGGGPIDRADGGAYDPEMNVWRTISTSNVPTSRHRHGAVWTGQEMIIWGGTTNFGGPMNSGGRYRPESDSWTPTSLGGPSPRRAHTAVWTGTRMIVWGGSSPWGNEGGQYDPALDVWFPVSTLNEPPRRTYHSAVWTGSEMIIWGGYREGTGAFLGDGGRYDPLLDNWRPVSATGAPTPRRFHTSIWTGTRMIVWGGDHDGGYDATGGIYDPHLDAWSPVSTIGAPGARTNHTAIWSGREMIVWGGSLLGTGATNTGGRYVPETNTWTTTSVVNAPTARYAHLAVWTGTRMIVVGAGAQAGLYDPVTDHWSPASAVNTPPSLFGLTAVWTGRQMVLWGGQNLGYWTTPWRYDPARDEWRIGSAAGTPIYRTSQTAVWTGRDMIIWGGKNEAYLSSGGFYHLGDHTDEDGDGYSECDGDCDDGEAIVHPGAAEMCNAIDDDCNGTVDDASAPGPVRDLIVGAMSHERVTWNVVPVATNYDVVTGSLAVLRSSSGDFSSAVDSCLADGIGATALLDARIPSPMEGFFYLVRGTNCAGAGSYDSGEPGQIGSRDAEIQTSAAHCP